MKFPRNLLEFARIISVIFLVILILQKIIIKEYWYFEI